MISKIWQILGLQPFKSFSRSLEKFFLTVSQNNFGNKIPLKSRELLQFQQKIETGTTVFYQWITFVLAIHAAMLRFPYMIWKTQEDGYMKSFYADGQGKSIENKVRIFYKTYKLNWGEGGFFFQSLVNWRSQYFSYLNFFTCKPHCAKVQKDNRSK